MPERILLIGDEQEQMRHALQQAAPSAQVTAVVNVFDGIAEMIDRPFGAVVAAAEPIERRPEAAVQTLRELAGAGRLVLFGHPTLEPLARKMLSFGADDYIVTPPSVNDLQHALGGHTLRLAGGSDGVENALPSPVDPFANVNVAGALLDAMLNHPADPLSATAAAVAAQLPNSVKLTLAAEGSARAESGRQLVRPIADESGQKRQIILEITSPDDADAAGVFLDTLAQQLGVVNALTDRHNRLQKLAITDDLTGLYNGRYFRHYLERIIARARDLMFPVTLLLFDIDNFKKYNDSHGHGVGDEILRQTAALMKKCVRDHDLVARISGDEFAVVFWEKVGPRQPRDAAAASPPVASRPPQTPVQILERFRRLLARELFNGLGPTGQGTLTISGGLAVFPYHAASVNELIEAADNALMFKAKKSGKNSIYLVGGVPAAEDDASPTPATP